MWAPMKLDEAGTLWSESQLRTMIRKSSPAQSSSTTQLTGHVHTHSLVKIESEQTGFTTKDSKGHLRS